MLKMSKKITAVIITCITALFCACSSEGGQTADVRTIIGAVYSASTDFPQHDELFSHDGSGKERDGWRDEFEILFDFEGEKAKEFAIYYSTALTADEIVVVKLANASDAEDFEQAANKHIEERLKDFRSYGPDEVAKLEGAVVSSQGNVCVIIVADDADAMHDAFNNSL